MKASEKRATRRPLRAIVSQVIGELLTKLAGPPGPAENRAAVVGLSVRGWL